jgi:hypothetical protein
MEQFPVLKKENLENTDIEKMEEAEVHLLNLVETIVEEISPGLVSLYFKDSSHRGGISSAGQVSSLLRDAIGKKFGDLSSYSESERSRAAKGARKDFEKLRPYLEGILKSLDE